MFLLILSTASAYTPSGMGIPEPLGGLAGPSESGALALPFQPAVHPERAELVLDLAAMRLGVHYELDLEPGHSADSLSTSPAPAFAATIPLERASLGLAMFPIVARGGAPSPADSPQRFFSIDGSLQVLTAEPSLALQVDDKWTVGVLGRVGYGMLDSKKAIDSGATINELTGEQTVALGDPFLEGTQSITGATGFAFGGGVGIRYQPRPKVQVDVSYRSPMTLTLNGPLTVVPSNDLNLELAAQVQVKMRMPAVAYASVRFPAGPVSLTVEGSFVGWGSLEYYSAQLSGGTVSSPDPVLQALLESYGLDEMQLLEGSTPKQTNSGMKNSLVQGLTVDIPLGEHLRARTGVWNYGSAIPDGYVNPSNSDYHVVGTRAAVAWSPRLWVELGISGDYFYAFERQIQDSFYAPDGSGASGMALPSSDGTYQVSLSRLGLTAVFRR